MDAVQHPVDMGLGLPVEDDLLNSDIQQLIHKVVLLRHHDMAVKRQVCLCPQLADQVQAERHAGTEMAIQYVHMDHADAGFLQYPDLALKVAHIQADQGRGNDAFLIPNIVRIHYAKCSFK